MPVHASLHGEIEVLSIEHGKVQAIDAAFIDVFEAALDGAARSPSRAVVLTGAGKVFSAGLDLIWTAAQDRAGMEKFVDAFDAMFEKVFFFPKPIVAAINGPAFAGGAVLALACDARVFAAAQPFALNEVKLGIPFPAAAFEISRQALPRIAWEEAMIAGATFPAERCRDLGLGKVTNREGVVVEAIAVAKHLAAGSASAIAAVKADLAAPVKERIGRDRAGRRARFLDHWFAPETRRLIEARLAEKTRR